jgi:phage terminase large subunit GpA-like protein
VLSSQSRQSPIFQSDADWLAEEFAALPVAIEALTPSEWAEHKRYLPGSVTSQPGPFSFETTPYLREIVDCFDPESRISEVAWMKGVQLAATTGLENVLGYLIDYVRDAPVMLITADAELARLRLEHHIIPMLHHSGLEHLIKSADDGNRRKTGKTQQRLEWDGGGYAILFGARNANKLRSTPVKILLRDEVDGWPRIVGKDGDPMRLSEDRTAAFEGGRKILDISTPLLKWQSHIETRFQRGDQRYYFVRCLKCGAYQRLRWRRVNAETGEVTGIVWQTKDGMLVPGSSSYACKDCGHLHHEQDKLRLFSPANGAEWRPTAVPVNPGVRSYHLSALYSQFQTWDACAQKWLDAWDVEANHPKDNAKLQVFYNNVLGEPYEIRGNRVKFEAASSHRRSWHSYGKVPNKALEQFCGSPALLLTCAVDVHSDGIFVNVTGWCRERRAILVEYRKLEGDTEQLEAPETWGELRKILVEKAWDADDGKRYKVNVAFIDSGYRPDQVYRFCAEYPCAHVYPIKGRAAPPNAGNARQFSEFVPVPGQNGINIVVDYYKDRWSAALRRQWDGLGIQPAPFFNAPLDITDAQLKELTAEVKRERIEATTGKRIGWEWHRPGNAPNELWDTLVYSDCALDFLAEGYSKHVLGVEFTNWAAFYDACAAQHLFFTV